MWAEFCDIYAEDKIDKWLKCSNESEIYSEIEELIIKDYKKYNFTKQLDKMCERALEYLVSHNKNFNQEKKEKLFWEQQHKSYYYKAMGKTFPELDRLSTNLKTYIQENLILMNSIINFKDEELFKVKESELYVMKVDLFKIITLKKIVEDNMFNFNIDKDIMNDFNRLITKYENELTLK